jgi:hypothetical protein
MTIETRQVSFKFSLLFFFITVLTFAYYKFHVRPPTLPPTWHSTTSNGARDILGPFFFLR